MATQYATSVQQFLHVRFEGRSFDLPVSALGIDWRSTDNEIRQALATRLEIHASRLKDSVIDRHVNGNLTIRPMAVFG